MPSLKGAVLTETSLLRTPLIPVSLHRFSYFFTAFLLCCQSVSGQWNETSLVPISFQNLDFFKPASGNWKIEGKTAALREINHKIETMPGVGVLVNRPEATAKDNLQSKTEYGDVDLEVELMLPKNSNSGFYLMGRYELQLFDSWGKENANFGDCGGIYERWDPARGKGKEGYEGFAPMSNECKAPGLWQKLQVSFDAPRFDASGKKIRNARFNGVWLNGIKIHNQLDLGGPTRGAISGDESAKGPLLIQGDHGPIAFRNLKIAEYGQDLLRLENLSYKVWFGQFNSLSLPANANQKGMGKSDLISKNNLEADDDYYIEYTGKLAVSHAGEYEFATLISGRSTLIIDSDTVIKSPNSVSWWDKRKGSYNLSMGAHSFRLVNSKSDPDKKSCLGLMYTGPGIREQNLHTEGSILSGTGSPTLSLEKEGKPYVQRSFYYHNGIRKAYGINVADPSGQHFTLNANTGRVNRVWRSDIFGDVTSMWVDRGSNQILAPKSATVQLTDKAVLGTSSENYGDTLTEKEGFKYLGYQQKPGHQPVFKYATSWGELELMAVLSAHSFMWEGILKTTSGIKSKPYHLVAEGKRIELLSDGAYLVDEQFYIVPDKSLEFIGKITDSAGMQKLFIQLSGPGSEARFRYGIIW